MKKILLLSIFIISGLEAISQQYGNNDWIDFSDNQPYSKQEYYKIKIHKDGLYRIYADSLVKAGIMVKTQASPGNPIDARYLQLFGRGDEQYIYLSGEVGGVFQNGGYIEFYGKGNDGWLDTRLYPKPQDQPNDKYSLFNDTAAYFLTWNKLLTNRRVGLDTDVDFSSHIPSTYFIRNVFQQYPFSYINGPEDAVQSSDPEYREGEGYACPNPGIYINGPALAPYAGNSNLPTFATPNIASGSEPYQFNTAIVGISNDANYPGDDHHAVFKIKQGASYTTFLDTSFKGQSLHKYSVNIPKSIVTDGDNVFEIKSVWVPPSPGNDVSKIYYISIKYPHTTNFSGENVSHELIEVPNSTTGIKNYLSLDNFNDNGQTPVLWNITENKRITVVKSGSNLKALIPNSAVTKFCYLTAESDITLILANDIKPVSSDPARFAKFINFDQNGANSDFVIITHNSLMQGANDYKIYRNQKGATTVVVDVDELYMQFAYGIPKHPLAIRGFANFALSKWTTKPAHFFLIGKSIETYETRNQYYVKTAGNDYSTQYAMNLVPTIGNPPSDNMLTSRINGSILESAIPVGRLSARTNQDIEDYLDKIKEYEAAVPDEWMKQAIHLGGGNDPQQLATFKAYLKSYENQYEDSLFGGNVHSFYKDQSTPQISLNATLKKLVEEGVTMITFFGHSAPTLFDISLEDPKNYNNKGKYSFFLANGCSAGQIHFFVQAQPGIRSSSENYVMIKDKGSIGFLATSSLGVIGPLNEFSFNFYKNLSRTYYGKTVGQIVQKTVRDIQVIDTSNVYLRGVCLAMTLEGDPSIVLNSHEKPDVKIEATSIFFNPSEVTTEQQQFSANVVITNIGRTFADSFKVVLKRRFSDNSELTYTKTIPPVYYKDTIVFTMPVDEQKGSGINLFDITIDSGNLIDETSTKNPGGEMNNSILGTQLFIKSTELLPVYPMKYAIVPKNTVTLKGVTGEIFAAERSYTMEIDTTDAFNSPSFLNTTITQRGGVVSWTPPITLKDSTVYFWRTKSTSGTKWNESSFIYIPDKKGWSQKHFFQFKNDEYLNTVYNKPARKIEFVNEVKQATILTQRGASWNSITVFLGNSAVRAGVCAGNALGVAIYDPSTDSVWITPKPSPYGNTNCPQNSPIGGFDFAMTNQPARDAFNAFVSTVVPDGHYIMAFSIGNHHLEDNADVRLALKALGSTQVDSAKNNKAYIFFTKKGSGVVHEAIGEIPNALNPQGELSLSDSVVLKWTNGYLTSERIGPAKKWEKIQWKPYTIDAGTYKDVARLSVIGINAYGSQQQVLISNLTEDSTSVIDISSRINAAQFPFIKFQAFLKDSTYRTPPQIAKWQVFYQGVPEVSLNPAKYFTFYKDTMEEGDVMRFATAVENISEYDTDSLKMKLTVMDANRLPHDLFNHRRKPLLSSGSGGGNDTLNIEGSFPTKGFTGLNYLWVEANADNDQPEQFRYNNIGSLPFYVKKDISNPLLDVTFDGAHILDGDIVSPKPRIVIKMNDENKYLPINDTSMFNLWILPPGESDLDKNRLFFKNTSTNPNLRFKAATAGQKVAEIEYTPTLLKDGIYTLIAEGVDASNNSSGNKRYRITFEVINKSSITGIFNYPNPFSTSTRFVFTLTGAELPTDFKIQIMTISGKVIREIMLNELGPLRIGRNITQYAWNGKDEFGDQLANGLYIYRVISKINGSDIEKKGNCS